MNSLTDHGRRNGAVPGFALLALFVFAGCPGTAERYDSPDSEEREPPAGEAVFYHFDVGQADATLIAGPDGTVLIDAGDWRRDDLVPLLEGAGVQDIDLIVLTHPHADHIGQVPAVVETFDVTEVWTSGWEHESQTFHRVLDAMMADDAGYHEPRAGDVQKLGDLIVEVLNPVEPLEDIHDGVSVRVRFGTFAAIYTGDAEVVHEAAMIERGHDLSAQLLQLGHHGSRTSSSREFLHAVGPEVALYSAAEGSQYGHPHVEVVERLRDLGIDLYGTPDSGTIVVTTDGASYEIAVETTASSPDVATDEDAEPVDCIDINRASLVELEDIVHIGSARAEELVDHRPYERLSQLDRIHGVAEATLRDIEDEGLACVR